MSEPNIIAAIDLGGTRTKFGIVSNGTIKASSMLPAQPNGSLEKHLGEVLAGLEQLCLKCGYTLKGCHGLGLLCTGLVDHKNMRVLSTNKKYDDATNFNFDKWCHEHTGLELRMENDARGTLIGEWQYGMGQGFDHLLMMTIGTGIGTAVISGGVPIRGPNFHAGNLGGHLLIRSGGRSCTCGSKGCLESEASGWALPILVQDNPYYSESSLRTLSSIGFRELKEAVDAGDRCAKSVWNHCQKTWGEALVCFVHMFDPQRIILSGGIANNSPELLNSFQTRMKQNAWANGQTVEVVVSQHPDFAGLIGASALFNMQC